MMFKGNRQYVGNPLGFNWLYYVSSGYGYRVHPITGVKDYHTGVDVAVPVGTRIFAGSAGTVIESGNNGNYGLAILIDYGNGVQARYAHCSQLNYDVGQTVQAGDIIALSGDTGTVTGPHLHMEIVRNGRHINPFFFMDGTVNY
jgi:murein DD-endopeptidase MepM/ murein hydrolase activator NlpD